MTTNDLLGLVSVLTTVLLALMAWIGNGMVEQLKKIATSVNKIETDLSVLSNDHNNLKADVKELKTRVNVLEN